MLTEFIVRTTENSVNKNRPTFENYVVNHKISQEHQLNSRRFPVLPGAISNSLSRRHSFSHRTLHHSVQLYDRLLILKGAPVMDLFVKCHLKLHNDTDIDIYKQSSFYPVFVMKQVRVFLAEKLNQRACCHLDT